MEKLLLQEDINFRMIKKIKLAVIAGTSESREFISLICKENNIEKTQKKFEITAFTATEYGREMLKNLDCSVNVGRLDKSDFNDILKNFDIVCDASHPFAQQVTKNVKEVCKENNIEYIRIKRLVENYDYDKIIYKKNKEETAEYLNNFNGNILFTTGVNTLCYYEENVSNFEKRAYARVLDTKDSRALSENSKGKIIYALPPFSVEDTNEIIEKYNIEIIVSKDSGKKGGIPEKIRSAEEKGISVILIENPDKDNGYSIDFAVEKILQSTYFN
jgi:precorrin-6x reductase